MPPSNDLINAGMRDNSLTHKRWFGLTDATEKKKKSLFHCLDREANTGHRATAAQRRVTKTWQDPLLLKTESVSKSPALRGLRVLRYYRPMWL